VIEPGVGHLYCSAGHGARGRAGKGKNRSFADPDEFSSVIQSYIPYDLTSVVYGSMLKVSTAWDIDVSQDMVFAAFYLD
jgi:hypothetical protein